MIIEISDRLIIVGTSHIAKQSLSEIKEAFEKHTPDVLAVELDPQRLQTLLHPPTKQKYPLSLIKHVGLTGYLFVVFGAFVQKKMGNIVGMQPGSEMKLGYTLAKEHQKRLLLADRPIDQTLRQLSRWKKREIFFMLWDMLKSPFSKEKLSINLHEVPNEEVLDKILKMFRKKYPSLYNILVHSRNIYLANAVKLHQKRFPDEKILLIIGAGHVEGVQKLLQK